jgi:hypothetical protein
MPKYSTAAQEREMKMQEAGWRRRSLFSVCDLSKGPRSGKALAQVYSPAECNSASRRN